MFVRRAVAGVAASVLAFALAGCADGDPEPKFTEPTTSAPSPVPTESEAPERESAEDFIRRWVEAGDRMQVTGATTEFLAISKGCADCAAIADYVTRVYERGGSIRFPGSTVVRLERTRGDSRNFELDLQTPETEILNADGTLDETLPAGVGKYLITLSKARQEWIVTNMGRR